MKGKPYMDGENNQFLLTGDDIEIRYLPDLRLAVIGYGNQGRAQALNLVDSGCDVVVGLRPDSPRLGRAESDGMTVLDLDKAAETSDMVFFLIPDETHTDVFNRYIEPVLKPGRTLVFAHGFADCQRHRLQFACGKFSVPPERSRHFRERRLLAESQLLLNEPIHIRRQCRPKCPGMSRIERVHLANARCLQRFADRFKKLFSMLFDQRFEEGHS